MTRCVLRRRYAVENVNHDNGKAGFGFSRPLPGTPADALDRSVSTNNRLAHVLVAPACLSR
jgi:hypothetical protein